MVALLTSAALLQLALIVFQVLTAGNPVTIESQAISVLAAVLAVAGALLKHPVPSAGFEGAAIGAWLVGAVFSPYLPFAFPFVSAYAIPASVSWLILLAIIAVMATAWREGRFPRGGRLWGSLAAGLVVGAVLVGAIEVALVIVVVLTTPDFGSF